VKDRSLFRPVTDMAHRDEEAVMASAFDQVADSGYPPARRVGWFA
jgi:hypothetical protein